MYCIVLYCIVLYCIVLYCIVLYCIILYCIVLYCIVPIKDLFVFILLISVLSFLFYPIFSAVHHTHEVFNWFNKSITLS